MMTRKNTKRRRADALRVDLIDHDHSDWPQVLASLDRVGLRDDLMLRDGYLSARQSLLVARNGKTVAGHLCFHVEPLPPKRSGERGTVVEARLDVLRIRPGFAKKEVTDLLVFAAERRASLLRCAGVVGLKQN